jgi:S1-C subfamily serine protease
MSEPGPFDPISDEEFAATRRRAAESEPASEPAPEPAPAAAQRRTRDPRIASAAAAAAVFVGVAAVAGAVIGHSLWTSQQQPAAISGGSGGFGGSGSFGGSGISPSSGTSTKAVGGPSDPAAIADKVDDALVDINVQSSYQGSAGAGTGIVISSDGTVVTNNHVITGATKITATDIGNGKTYDVKVVGYDPSHDIAVLKLQDASGLATAKLGDSSQLSVGDAVVGVGNAGGAGGTPSSAGGSIGALNQTITAADDFDATSEQLSGLIQVNADIQPGDSGGALVDADGNVIGMNTAGAVGFRFEQGTSQAYAIPINQVAETATHVLAGHGSSTLHLGDTAFLGVSVGSADNGGLGDFGQGGSSSTGVQVGGVLDGQAAQSAGLSAGDVITSLGGAAVDSPTTLSGLMLRYHPGDNVQVGWTDTSGLQHSTSVTLGSGPPA